MLHAYSKQLPNTFDASSFLFHALNQTIYSFYEHFYMNSSALTLSLVLVLNQWLNVDVFLDILLLLLLVAFFIDRIKLHAFYAWM